MKTLRDLFLNQLAEMYDAEQRIDKALTKLARAATSDDLKTALGFHLMESAGQVRKLAAVFHCFDQKPKARRCAGVVGLLQEGAAIATAFKGSAALNAALIAAAQKVEHYEIATYGCLHEWAGLLANARAAELLGEILQQETAANQKLTDVAFASSNTEALGESEIYTMEDVTEETQTIRRRRAA